MSLVNKKYTKENRSPHNKEFKKNETYKFLNKPKDILINM